MALKLFDTVATLNCISSDRLIRVEPDLETGQQLSRGQVGTVVDVYENPDGSQYLIEFSDLQGREYAMATLNEQELLPLHYKFIAA